MKRRKIAKLRELSPDESSGPSAPRQETIAISRFRELTDKCIGRRMRTVVIPDIPTDDHGDQEQTDNVESDVDRVMEVDDASAQDVGTDGPDG